MPAVTYDYSSSCNKAHSPLEGLYSDWQVYKKEGKIEYLCGFLKFRCFHNADVSFELVLLKNTNASPVSHTIPQEGFCTDLFIETVCY